jgi:hypothetical protein
MWLKDVRPEVTLERNATKFMANHYLSWNVSNKLNIGLFESVIWTNTTIGFDASFVNPIILSICGVCSHRTGNALLGFTYKYKWSNQVNFMAIPSMSFLGDIKSGDNSWKINMDIGC